MVSSYIQKLIDEQTQIVKIMCVISYGTYASNPTYEQMRDFTRSAAQRGYSLDSIYSIFSSGEIPTDLDALIKDHALNWRPSGEIVDSTLEQRRITG